MTKQKTIQTIKEYARSLGLVEENTDLLVAYIMREIPKSLDRWSKMDQRVFWTELAASGYDLISLVNVITLNAKADGKLEVLKEMDTALDSIR